MKKEIALLRKLRHPSIIEFIGYGSFDNTSTRRAEESLFLVEEFVNGGTLKGGKDGCRSIAMLACPHPPWLH
jgi:serine/threonine protein kinase